ncbi:hypothetical protein MRX96_001017 [Rhipicephalus microplus]
MTEAVASRCEVGPSLSVAPTLNKRDTVDVKSSERSQGGYRGAASEDSMLPNPACLGVVYLSSNFGCCEARAHSPLLL